MKPPTHQEHGGVLYFWVIKRAKRHAAVYSKLWRTKTEKKEISPNITEQLKHSASKANMEH